MNFDEFVNKYLGKATDYDGGYGVQCVDLAKLYLDEVFNIKIGAIGNAHAYYDNFEQNSILKNNFTRIPNNASFIPQRGDICVWSTTLNKYGHIAIATGEGDTSYFYTYDQNWGSKEMRKVKHNYACFSGVLRPNDQNKIFLNSQNQIIDIFDGDLYNSLYTDLQKAFKGNPEKLKEHFNNYGVLEGRIASYVFNPHFYYAKYEDLAINIGPNCKELYNHFINLGIKEGRQAAAEFDVNFYKNNNDDLRNMSNEEAVRHFLQYGINEGRVTSAYFNVQKYKSNYEDLRDAFKDNMKQYFKHYILFGKNENRRAI